jgi:hypothetical protein
MHEPALEEASSPAHSGFRGRKRWLLGGFLLFMAAAAAGLSYYLIVSSEQRLQEALAEADRTDPGWHLLELQAARRNIGDEQNSAIHVANAKVAMPPQWPFWDVYRAAGPPWQSPEERSELRESLANLDPPVLLDERQVSALRQELKRARESLAELYKIKDLPHGRFPVTYTKDFIGTLLPHIQDTRTVANLLVVDARLRAHDQDLEGALLACRCLMQAQRAIGDEPTAVSMLVRIAIRHMAVKEIERIVAQGQPPEAALAGLQQLLEEELAEPLFLIAARGERGGIDQLLAALQAGEIKSSWNSPQILAPPGEQPSVLQSIRFKFAPGSIKTERAALLRFNNQVVEFAKLSVEEQTRRMPELNLDSKNMPSIARSLSMTWPKLVNTFRRDQATLRCGILLLAVERYRRAQQRWPERLDDLAPVYVAKVPIDPFARQPMRFGRFDGGLVIYSVSFDGQDNGGTLAEDFMKPGTDWGHRLWDLEKRRQPARPRK